LRKGARFGKEHADLAVKAASQLQLQVLAGNDPKIVEIVARLPVGRARKARKQRTPSLLSRYRITCRDRTQNEGHQCVVLPAGTQPSSSSKLAPASF
jgi:hypothetical protein